MARYIITVRTRLSAQAAFAYMADLGNFAEWDPGVKRVTQIEGSGGGPDASFDVVVASVPSDLTLRYVTKQYVEPRLVLIEARSRMLTSIDRISIAEDSASGCLVTYDAELTLNQPLSWANFALRPLFKRIGDRAGRGLVAALAGEVVAS
jgi:hypothetical protein